MILIDANVLLYAYNSSCPQHQKAKQYLEDLLSGDYEVQLPWIVLLAFLRISTNPKAFPLPLKSAEARAAVSSWLGLPSVRVVDPGPDHWKILDRLLEQVGAAGNLTTDAHIAALAIERGAVLASCDEDFGTFEDQGLIWSNPLRD